MQAEGLIYTNENCIGCNKCVGVCSSMGACISQREGGRTQIAVDPLRCTACGACFTVCAHDARSYTDDTDRFFRDLADGVPISVLLSPAIESSFPASYRRILGTLRVLGARRLLPVAFGADICTWATLRYLAERPRMGFLSSRCPVIVSYIEHFHPELLGHLLPVQSPTQCMAIYARTRLYITDRLAYIGPCIGKTLEKQRDGRYEAISYNITLRSLMKYLEAHGLGDATSEEDTGYGLGLAYPAPDGLATNLRWFLGDDIYVRSVSGKRYAYRWLDRNADGLLRGALPFSIVDIVNCQDGCLEGTANAPGCNDHDQAYYTLLNRMHQREVRDDAGPWNKSVPPAERLALLNERFEGLNPRDYQRTYRDRSAQCQDWQPSREEEDAIYDSLHKYDEASRHIDCAACGYDTCAHMVRAIYNGFNDVHSCIHYEQAEATRLEKLSLYDEVTDGRSHNAYLLASEYGNGIAPQGTIFIMADVNGLKRANDTLGHAEGDRLLTTAARELAAALGKDHVYRIGGDEFAAFTTELPHDAAQGFAESIQQKLELANVSVAFGLARPASGKTSYKDLQAEADRAMYKDKIACYARHGWKPRE